MQANIRKTSVIVEETRQDIGKPVVPPTRKAAALALHSLGGVARSLEGTDPGLRLAAVRCLGIDECFVEDLVGFLEDAGPNVRRAAVDVPRRSCAGVCVSPRAGCCVCRRGVGSAGVPRAAARAIPGGASAPGRLVWGASAWDGASAFPRWARD